MPYDTHLSLINIVSMAWNMHVDQRPLKKFSTKLKILKSKLSLWNKERFGNIQQNVKLAEEEVSLHYKKSVYLQRISATHHALQKQSATHFALQISRCKKQGCRFSATQVNAALQ